MLRLLLKMSHRENLDTFYQNVTNKENAINADYE